MRAANQLHPARLVLGNVEWSIEPCTNMAIFHEDNANDDDALPTDSFILIDRGNRRILLSGRCDSFMLGEVITRLMRQAARRPRRSK